MCIAWALFGTFIHIQVFVVTDVYKAIFFYLFFLSVGCSVHKQNNVGVWVGVSVRACVHVCMCSCVRVCVCVYVCVCARARVCE